MKCQELIDFLMSYLDGELPEETATAFREHLDLCPPCVHYLDSYRKTIELGKICCEEQDELPADVPDELVRAILAARRQAG